MIDENDEAKEYLNSALDALSRRIFEVVRQRISDPTNEQLKEIERNLSKVRRSVEKAIHTLRNVERHEEWD